MGSVRRAPRTGRWEARYRDPSGRQRTRTFHNKSSARAFLATVEVDIRRGEWRDPRLARITFESWVEGVPGVGSAQAGHDDGPGPSRAPKALPTRPGSPAAQRHHAPPRCAFGGSDEFRPRSQDRADERWSPPGRHVSRGRRGAPPTESMPEGSGSRPRTARAPRFLSVGELQRLAEAMPIEYRAMVYVGGVLGLRWSEVAGLRLGRIDFERRTLQVVETVAEVEGRLSVEDVKTRASRATLPVPPRVAEVLVSHVATLGPLQPGGPRVSEPGRWADPCHQLPSAGVEARR